MAPDRGAQGNALKTIVAMPFVLDGEEGRVDIVGGGVQNEIALSVDRIRQRPAAAVQASEAEPRLCGSTGRRELVHVRTDEARFLQVADDFTFLNPHLTSSIDHFGRRSVDGRPTPPGRSGHPSSPTPAHWYRPEHLERLIGAYLAHDLDR